jgi:hypothetical protein
MNHSSRDFRVIFFPDSPPCKGSIPSFFPTSENGKKKGLKIKMLFSFRGTDIWINPNMIYVEGLITRDIREDVLLKVLFSESLLEAIMGVKRNYCSVQASTRFPQCSFNRIWKKRRRHCGVDANKHHLFRSPTRSAVYTRLLKLGQPVGVPVLTQRFL